LEDRVQSLEEELDRVNTKSLEVEVKPCDETLHAKDQYITKLEKEKKDLESECHKMVKHLEYIVVLECLIVHGLTCVLSSTIGWLMPYHISHQCPRAKPTLI